MGLQLKRARAPGSAHMAELDGLRALAAIAVIFQHTMRKWWDQFDLGGMGVNLFFVMSGFLIAGILLDARTKAENAGLGQMGVGKAFYARRFLRIFPLYYAVLALGVLLGFAAVRQTLPWTATYLTNVYAAKINDWPVMPVTAFWSLAIEEQFYLIVPALLLLLPRKGLIPFAWAMVVLAPICRVILGLHWHSGVAPYMFLPARMDTLGIGVLIALMRRRENHANWRVPGWVAIAGLGLWIAATQLYYHEGMWLFMLAFYFVGQGAMAAWVISRASLGFGGIVGKSLRVRPLMYLGQISYGIYVFHGFVIAELMRLPRGEELSHHRVGFIVVTALSIAVAAISWHLFESPINSLKKLFPYQGTRPVERITAPEGLLEKSTA